MNLQLSGGRMTGRCMRLLRANSKNWLVQARQRQSSSFNEQWATEEKHAKSTMITWKRISLFVGIPIVSYLTWKHIIEKEARQSTAGSFRNTMNEMWLTYLHDDPEARDQDRWEHLKRVQQRKKDYLAKKRAAIDTEIPLQPMDLFTEIKNTPVNEIDSEMEN